MAHEPTNAPSIAVDHQTAWQRTWDERTDRYMAGAPIPNADIKRIAFEVAHVLAGHNQTHDSRIKRLESWSAGIYSRDVLEAASRYADCDEWERLRILEELEASYTPQERNAVRNWTIGTSLTIQEWEDNDREQSAFLATTTAVTTTKNSKLVIERFDELKPRLERPGNLVGGFLDTGALSVLFGDSWTGKSLVAQSLAYHVATGLPWWGRTTQQGLVVYLALEGSAGARNRFVALGLRHGVPHVQLALIPCPVDLSGRGIDTQPLLDLIATVGRPSLVIVDTISRALFGTDENSSTDMGALVKNLDRLRGAMKCHLMAIHHSGKDAARGARGHSSLRAACDSEFEVIHDPKTRERKIMIRKQRDSDILTPIGFGIESVDLGHASDGSTITAPIAVGCDLRARADFNPVRPRGVSGRALTVLEDLELNSPTVSLDAWRAEFIRAHYSGKAKVGRQAFDRATKELLSAGHVIVESGRARSGVRLQMSSNIFNEDI